MPRKQLNIGVRPEDYELVLAAAEEAGQDVTGFCRAAILRAAAPQPVEPQPAASNGSVVLPAAFFWTLAQPYIEAYQQAQEPAAPWWRFWQRWQPGQRQQRQPELATAGPQIAEGAVVDAVYTG